MAGFEAERRCKYFQFMTASPVAGTIGQLIDHHMTAHGWCPACARNTKIDLAQVAAKVGRDWTYVRQRWPVKCASCGGELSIVIGGDTRTQAQCEADDAAAAYRALKG